MTFICLNTEQRLPDRPPCDVQCRSCYEHEGRLKEFTAPFDGYVAPSWDERLQPGSAKASQEKREAKAVEKARKSGRAQTYIDKDGCEVTAMPSGHVFYNAGDWW